MGDWGVDERTEQACRDDARQVLAIVPPLFTVGLIFETLSHVDGRLPWLLWWHVASAVACVGLLLVLRSRRGTLARPELALLFIWALLMASIVAHAMVLEADAMGGTLLVLAVGVIVSGALILPLVVGLASLLAGAMLFFVLWLQSTPIELLKALPTPVMVSLAALAMFLARRWSIRQAQLNREIDRTLLENEARLAHARETSAMAARLSRGFAHHFRNQLQTIFSGVDGASLHVQGDHPAQQFLDNVGRAAQHAARMVSELVGYADERPLNASTFAARTLFDKLDLPAMVGPPVRLTVEVPDCRVHGDLDQLIVAIREMVSNARTAVSDRDGRIQVSVTESPQALDIVVTDNGSGVSAGLPGEPTAPFVTSDEHSRFGLGLAVVTAVAARHGGCFDIVSSSAHGTTVRLRLPPATAAVNQTRGAENVSQRR